MTAQHSLSIAIVAIYLALSFPTIFVAFKHGTRGLALLGWGYLFVFCSLKIIGSALQLSNPSSTGASVVTSIGLSPLILAASGVLHEGRFYRFNDPRAHKSDIFGVVSFHFLVTMSVVFIATGASRLVSASTSGASPAKIDEDWHLAAVGTVMLLVAWMMLVVIASVSLLFRVGQPLHDEAARNGRKLMIGVACALPFLGVRVLASVVYFCSRNMKLSPVGGSMGLQVGLEVVEEIIAAVIFLAVGLLTRNVNQSSSGEDVTLKAGSGYLGTMYPGAGYQMARSGSPEAGSHETEESRHQK